jgi:predicted dehydrogenase
MTGSGTDRPRVGLVGYGGAGRSFHAPLLTEAGFQVAAVVTANPERAAQVRDDLPDAEVLPDLAALLSTGGLDLVVLASPTGVHVPQVHEVVAAGLPVVVDKPLGVDASSALEAVDAAAHAGVPLTVFQNRRYDPEFRTLAHVVSEGLVGDVVRAELRWERWRPVPKQRWRENAPPAEGGGLLLDLFPHLVDQAQVLFGPVETVYAELFAYTTVGEDTAFLSCRHTSGTVSHLASTSLAAAPGPWVRLLGREGAFVVGSLEGEPTAFSEWGAADPAHLGWLLRGNGQREAVARVPGQQADFYREVAQALTQTDPQTALPVDPRDAVHALALIDAARTSAESGRVVEVVTPGEAP